MRKEYGRQKVIFSSTNPHNKDSLSQRGCTCLKSNYLFSYERQSIFHHQLRVHLMSNIFLKNKYFKDKTWNIFRYSYQNSRTQTSSMNIYANMMSCYLQLILLMLTLGHCPPLYNKWKRVSICFKLLYYNILVMKKQITNQHLKYSLKKKKRKHQLGNFYLCSCCSWQVGYGVRPKCNINTSVLKRKDYPSSRSEKCMDNCLFHIMSHNVKACCM